MKWEALVLNLTTNTFSYNQNLKKKNKYEKRQLEIAICLAFHQIYIAYNRKKYVSYTN